MKRVLVLEKNPFIRYLIVRTLQSAATVVVTASRIEKAIAELKASHSDLFFVDMQTLNHSTLEILSLLKELSPQTKIMLMSGTCSAEELAKRLQETIYCFISKPFFPSEIRQLAGKSLGLGEDFWKQSQTTANRRRDDRTPVTETIQYTVNVGREGTGQPKKKGNIINISDGGIGMLTEGPITSGTLLTFCGGVEHDEGIVAWSRKVDHNTFSAGIVFV